MTSARHTTLLLLGLSLVAPAAERSFSDPARVPPPPPGAVGQAVRTPDLDALPGFVQPPPGFGDVAFYWWLGDPLTRERLQWQIDQLAGKGVSGLQINYAHDDKGGQSYGLTFPSDPPLFSEEWWQLQQWFLQAAKAKGMAVSLSDYTLGTAGQGSYIDEILAKYPKNRGATLRHVTRRETGGKAITWTLPPNTLSAVAYQLNGETIVPDSAVDLRNHITGGQLQWPAPAGTWRLVAVSFDVRDLSVDPLHPDLGKHVIEVFFQRFEDRNPGEAGKGLNFFFSDELQFGVGGKLWNAALADEFKRRKGYDLIPELAALFVDTGPRTPKVRLDYSDVVVALQEEGYFKPLYDWHQQRGMIYGCDHGGRGRAVNEFGDYFRTQRWNQGPGADQPRLGRDLIKAKVAASIAHLYERPRVWLEGYYSSGWGTSSAQVADATFANFAMGFNLLTLHGLYYSTHGGWWEWAPPCNHYHMPYWQHMGQFLECVQRLSYLMSQGHHRCDVAILYPVAPKEAELDGDAAVQAAFATAESLYRRGIDFDFMDFESLARAQVQDGQLRVSGEIYRALVIPSMKAVRFSTVQKAAELQRAGGLVILEGALPEASERVGRNDPELNALVAELSTRAGSPDQVRDLVERSIPRDYTGPGAVQHRRIGPRDVYLVYGGSRDAEAVFRATGRVDLWDPWTGQTRPLPVLAQTVDSTRLQLPLSEREVQLIVFSAGQPVTQRASVAKSEVIPVSGDWEFELYPVLDNRFGDYHWPPTPNRIGAEVRQLEYSATGSTNGPWQRVTCSFGPQFWKLGPLPDNFDETQLVGLKFVDPAVPVEFGGKHYRWEPYEFSWRWGKEGDPGHQGYHGLKGEVTDHFLCLGAPTKGKNETVYTREREGSRYYLWTSVPVDQPTGAYPRWGGLEPKACWVNHQRADHNVQLQPGANPVLVRYDQPGRGFFVVDRSAPKAGAAAAEEVFSAAASWIWYPNERTDAERWFFRAFTLDSVPARSRLRITCDNGYTVSLNGHPVGHGSEWTRVQEYDVAKSLRPGRNELVVAAVNTGDSAGLIAELRTDNLVLATDNSWLTSKTATGVQVAAESRGTFRDSGWFKHPLGPPKLPGSGQFAKPVFERKPLAMTWWTNTSILPFDVYPQTAKAAGWYRFTAPPGLKGLRIKARGNLRIWADGQEMRSEGDGRFDLATPTSAPARVLLQVESERGAYGGAALAEYLELDCRPGPMALGDWAEIDGLLSYSGGAWYRKTVTLPAATEVTLDLGDLVSTAELVVNGRPAGIRVAPPWTFDITKLVRPGENRLEVMIRNTLGNHYTSIPTAYRGSTRAGLLGPVKLELR